MTSAVAINEEALGHSHDSPLPIWQTSLSPVPSTNCQQQRICFGAAEWKYGVKTRSQTTFILILPVTLGDPSIEEPELLLVVRWVGVDSIAVSLSTNSVRRQDPNVYSDTETRALSRSGVGWGTLLGIWSDQ